MPNPPDIRKLISGVLEEHFFVMAKCDEDADEQFDDAIEALLSLPGIAIVQLPELDSHWATRKAVEVCDGLKVIAKRSAVLVEDEETLTSHTLRVARALAAALLAAAAEADHA